MELRYIFKDLNELVDYIIKIGEELIEEADNKASTRLQSRPRNRPSLEEIAFDKGIGQGYLRVADLLKKSEFPDDPSPDEEGD